MPLVVLWYPLILEKLSNKCFTRASLINSVISHPSPSSFVKLVSSRFWSNTSLHPCCLCSSLYFHLIRMESHEQVFRIYCVRSSSPSLQCYLGIHAYHIFNNSEMYQFASFLPASLFFLSFNSSHLINHNFSCWSSSPHQGVVCLPRATQQLGRCED